MTATVGREVFMTEYLTQGNPMTLSDLVVFVLRLVERIERLEDAASARLCSEQLARASQLKK